MSTPVARTQMGGLEEAPERWLSVPERDVRRERREEPVHRPPPAKQHAERDGQRQHRAEEDGLADGGPSQALPSD